MLAMRVPLLRANINIDFSSSTVVVVLYARPSHR